MKKKLSKKAKIFLAKLARAKSLLYICINKEAKQFPTLLKKQNTMTITQFDRALAQLELELDNKKKSIESLVVELVKIHDLQKAAEISSEDYASTSRVYSLESKHFLVVAESSDLDQFKIVNEFDEALKIATDFCAR